MEITKKLFVSANGNSFNYSVKSEYGFVADFYYGTDNSKEEAESYATLLADAGNTYQSTKKLPSELAEANKELLQALKSILKSHRQMSFEKDGNLNDTFIETKIDNLIKKYTNA